LRRIASLGTEIEVRADKVLAQQGKPGREFFLVMKGRARCLIDGQVVASLGPWDYFGEMALLDHGPRRATVSSEEPMTLLVLNVTEFDQILAESPAIAKKLLLSFVARDRANAALRH
jgi:CRP-like cAMP-binding protein